MLLPGSVFVLLCGLFMLLAPDLFYEATQSWKNSAASGPSDWYRIETRIGGGFFALAGVAGLVVFFAAA